MLVPEELKRYGFQRKLKLIDQIWLDYVQDHLLNLLYREYPDLVFRGGTCLWKVYGGQRFSEDLDLAIEEAPGGLAEYLLKELELLGFTVGVEKERETENMYRLRLGVDRPDSSSTTPVSVEILKDSTSKEKITEKEIHSPYPDVPRIDVRALTKDALLAEKISAICERNRPRDMDDVYRLLKNGAEVTLDTVRDEYRDFTMEVFEESLEEKKSGWEGLESLMVGDLPKFEKEKQYILQSIQKMLGKDSRRS